VLCPLPTQQQESPSVERPITYRRSLDVRSTHRSPDVDTVQSNQNLGYHVVASVCRLLRILQAEFRNPSGPMSFGSFRYGGEPLISQLPPIAHPAGQFPIHSGAMSFGSFRYGVEPLISQRLPPIAHSSYCLLLSWNVLLLGVYCRYGSFQYVGGTLICQSLPPIAHSGGGTSYSLGVRVQCLMLSGSFCHGGVFQTLCR
jgi:hypothetical protein